MANNLPVKVIWIKETGSHFSTPLTLTYWNNRATGHRCMHMPSFDNCPTSYTFSLLESMCGRLQMLSHALSSGCFEPLFWFASPPYFGTCVACFCPFGARFWAQNWVWVLCEHFWARFEQPLTFHLLRCSAFLTSFESHWRAQSKIGDHVLICLNDLNSVRLYRSY